jgi:hypothetical protein
MSAISLSSALTVILSPPTNTMASARGLQTKGTGPPAGSTKRRQAVVPGVLKGRAGQAALRPGPPSRSGVQIADGRRSACERGTLPGVRLVCGGYAARSDDHVSGMRSDSPRENARDCLPAVLPMLSVRGGNEATGGRLLRLLFLRGHLLPAKADGVAAALSAPRNRYARYSAEAARPRGWRATPSERRPARTPAIFEFDTPPVADLA